MEDLLKKIESLPKGMQIEIGDFVDFLIVKYHKILEDKLDVSDEEKAMLEARWKEYIKNPDNKVSFQSIKEKYQKRYGLSS